jgi:hypothetical protein
MIDLMVEDLSETHKRFTELGLGPTALERVSSDVHSAEPQLTRGARKTGDCSLSIV